MQSPYIHFIALLVHSHFSRPIVLLEFRDISMRFCLRAQDVDSVATATVEVCSSTSCHACVHKFDQYLWNERGSSQCKGPKLGMPLLVFQQACFHLPDYQFVAGLECLPWPPSAPYLTDMHVRMQIVQLLGFKDAHVVGHSFGSFVASMLCQVYPEMVKSLVRQDLGRRT